MSSPSFTHEEEEPSAVKNVLSADYRLTEEEKKVMLQCSRESFFYRALPSSVISMVITQNLVARGILSASPRFGSLPKVAFAGVCGYMAGKLSYMKMYQEKLKALPNSPLGEFLRQQSGSLSAQRQVSEPNGPSYDTPMFQPAETPYGVSSMTTGDEQMVQPDDSTPVQSYEDEEPKKSILYENLRLRNRENYEVMLNQKPDTMIKAPSEKEPERPKKPVKKNIYGDTWEE